MKSLGAMVKQLSGLVGTTDLNDWESDFVESIDERTRNGADTAGMTDKQIASVQRIYSKHFGDGK